jgi:hypothetical protein
LKQDVAFDNPAAAESYTMDVEDRGGTPKKSIVRRLWQKGGASATSTGEVDDPADDAFKFLNPLAEGKFTEMSDE